ncbi:MAG TPA: Ig-like domain-containing protein, partial [Thermoanaerobaculia bacterium]|nr:Ig-like domain-containing protein [Thermoanaerobaculia bacterium]
MEAGGGGGGISGGGVVRITAGNVVVDGAIRGNGTPSGEGSGAGGSIWITTGRITGTGVIETNSIDSCRGMGGGGAVSIEYSDATSTLPALRSRTGRSTCDSLHGGAGSIYVRGPQSTFGDLTFDNGTLAGPAIPLPSLGGGTAQAGTSGSSVVISVPSLPAYFAGHWIEIWTPAGSLKGTWRIASISGTTVVLEGAAGETVDVQPGDVWYGVYRVDTLKQRIASLITADRILYTTLDKDTSTLNNGAPRFDGTKVASIVLESDATGHYVRGPIGAIVDDNKPVIVTATNKRSNATFPATAGNDGSFSIKVEGIDDDRFILYATDANSLRSRTVDVNGAIGANSVQSLTVAPQTLGGGTNSKGTITLALPAGTSGAVVALTSSNSSYAVVPATVSIPSGALTVQFDIVTYEPPANVEVVITATLGASLRTATLNITRDSVGPTVTVTAPAANTQYNEGSANLINVRATVADDFSGIKRVYATIDGQSTDLAKDNSQPNLYTGNVPAPFIDGNVNATRDLTVTGVDGRDNATTSPAIPLVIKPVVDAGLPTVAWSCSSDGVYPVGHTAKLRVIAKAPNATNYMARIEVFLSDANGVVATLFPAPVSGVPDAWEAVYIVPDLADGTTFSTRVVATTAASTTAEITGSLTIVKGGIELTGTQTIADTNTTYENKSLIIRSGTTTIAGTHVFTRLVVLEGATVTHAATTTASISATAIYVACGGSYDVSGGGYGNNTTYPGASTPHQWTGGSHIGRSSGEGNTNATYGSIERPVEFGSGPYSYTYNGGGAVRLSSSTVSIDGAIRANGAGNTTDGSARSGGGGSVWITTGKITGAGVIQALGGDCYNEAGGGGAISITYTDASSTLPALSVRGGASPHRGLIGGAGSIFVKRPESAFGDLTIDNAGLNGNITELPSLGSGA